MYKHLATEESQHAPTRPEHRSFDFQSLVAPLVFLLGCIAFGVFSSTCVECQINSADLPDCQRDTSLWQQLVCLAQGTHELNNRSEGECIDACRGVRTIAHPTPTETFLMPHGIRFSIDDDSSCAAILAGDVANSSTGSACVDVCDQVFQSEYLAWPCWLDYSLAWVCFKAKVSTLVSALPAYTGKAVAVTYIMISIAVTYLTYNANVKPINWRWNPEVQWKFPFCCRRSHELEYAKFQLGQTALSMLADRFSDILAIFTYLLKGQPFYSLVSAATIVVSGDPLQVRGLSALTDSFHRGYVATQQLNDSKAREAIIEGAWGVLIPALTLYDVSATDWRTIGTLMLAMATSLYSVFDGAGGGLELAGAMVARNEMTFAAQANFAKLNIKLLRVAEICAMLLPCAVLAERMVLTSLLLCILPAFCIFTCTWLVSPGNFQDANPRHAKGRPRALLTMLMITVSTPFILLWPGSFKDAKALSLKRSAWKQHLVPVAPRKQHYYCRVAIGVSTAVVLCKIKYESAFELPWLQVCLLTLGLVSTLAIPILLAWIASDGKFLVDTSADEQAILALELADLEQQYGADHREVAITLTNLGIAYGSLGDAARKKELLERALAIKEREYGADHREVAITLTNLGNAYGDLGDAARKKELLERALAIKEREYGADHREVAITLTNLGSAYGQLGDAARQKELLERALAIKEREYGADHREVAITLTNLGIAYGRSGDAARKKELLERALAVFQRHYGEEHPHVAFARKHLQESC